MLGTADMITQLADRCYLEKCRDRLYPEFVLGGVALPIGSNGYAEVKYASGLDLLRQTPAFVADDAHARGSMASSAGAYRYLDIALRRPQSLYRGDRSQHAVPRAGAAQRELAHAAP